MENVDVMLEHARFVEIAQNLLSKYSIDELRVLAEDTIREEIKPDYADPAVIIAICKKLAQENRKQWN
jgi:hypothetical protein